MDDILKTKKVLISAGTGGVGKTTVSAALGIRAAQLGLRVLVMTIDPAKRLATSLGLSDESSQEVRVPNQNYKGELFAATIDPTQVFEELVKSVVKDVDAVSTIFNNFLYKQLSTTLAGSQEYSSLERLYQANVSGKYDLIILDTPPAQHAADFLSAPQRFYALFQDSILKWFINKDRGGFISGVINRGTQLALKVLETLTGAEFIKELSLFFNAIQAVQPVIREHSIAIQRLLTGKETTFVLVSSFDHLKIKEAIEFERELAAGGYDLSALILNRAIPEWLEIERSEIDPGSGALWKDYALARAYHLHQWKTYENLDQKLRSHIPVIRLREFATDIHDLQYLEDLAKEIYVPHNK